MRSIPLLKTIPSQLEVTLYPPELNENGASQDVDSSNSSSSVVKGGGSGIGEGVRTRAPSIASTLSSTSSQSSSRPTTPVTPFDSVCGINKPGHPHRFGHHRRHASNPVLPPKGLNSAPLSSSYPNKSILTRTSSISTKDSVTTANKSVKFVEVPTVHYASAGYWDVASVERMEVDSPPHVDDMGMDLDIMDIDSCRSRYRNSRAPYRRERTGPYAGRGAVSRMTDFIDELPDCETQDPEPDFAQSGALKRLMTFKRSSRASRGRKHASAYAQLSTSLPPTPSIPRPVISGPYALGSHPVSSSPAHSTTSLRSNMSRSSKASKSFLSFSSVTPTSGITNSYGTGVSSLENYRSARNPATRSVRSLGSVKSSSSTASGLKSWLSRIAAGRAAN
ncbi:hypothetical protein CC2G_000860 [Coprinopsis cinerea AmutBmut pab1-1]|nr:hypothetical protein CC2G_000860 [Coprinopsis cinerea AmutBmut pab1-1]